MTPATINDVPQIIAVSMIRLVVMKSKAGKPPPSLKMVNVKVPSSPGKHEHEDRTGDREASGEPGA